MQVDYAGRAKAHVGTRFRPQGRSRAGLDCVGLVLATFDIPGDAVRRDYRLSGDHRRELEQGLIAHFRKVARSALRAGDVMLITIAPSQLHLAIKTLAGFVHAHAGIGRVVETPGMPHWPVASVYRRRSR